jgi:hypothetical protein
MQHFNAFGNKSVKNVISLDSKCGDEHMFSFTIARELYPYPHGAHEPATLCSLGLSTT